MYVVYETKGTSNFLALSLFAHYDAFRCGNRIWQENVCSLCETSDVVLRETCLSDSSLVCFSYGAVSFGFNRLFTKHSGWATSVVSLSFSLVVSVTRLSGAWIVGKYPLVCHISRSQFFLFHSDASAFNGFSRIVPKPQKGNCTCKMRKFTVIKKGFWIFKDGGYGLAHAVKVHFEIPRNEDFIDLKIVCNPLGEPARVPGSRAGMRANALSQVFVFTCPNLCTFQGTMERSLGLRLPDRKSGRLSVFCRISRTRPHLACAPGGKVLLSSEKCMKESHMWPIDTGRT